LAAVALISICLFLCKRPASAIISSEPEWLSNTGITDGDLGSGLTDLETTTGCDLSDVVSAVSILDSADSLEFVGCCNGCINDSGVLEFSFFCTALSYSCFLCVIE